MLREADRHGGFRHGVRGVAGQRQPIGLLRLLPAVLAAYELRYLIDLAVRPAAILRLIGSLHVASAGSWMSALLLVCAAGLIRFSGCGLRERVPRLRWSRRMLCVWVGATVALLVLFHVAGLQQGTTGAPHAAATVMPVTGPHVWATVAASMLIGLLLAASLESVCSFTRAVASLCAACIQVPVWSLVSVGSATRQFQPRLAAVIDGWSSRGPPQAAAAASVI